MHVQEINLHVYAVTSDISICVHVQEILTHWHTYSSVLFMT